MNPVTPQPSRSLLLTIFLLTVIEFLQSGMIAFSAGPIMGEIGAAPEEFSLATAAYACIAITVIAKQRWMVERIGWRSFVLGSLTIFSIGCLICGTSESFPAFLIGRIVMGLGGASFMTSGRVIVNLIPPGPGRFRGIKHFASGLAGGIAFAPGLASFSVAHDRWNLIFGILIAVAILTALFAAHSLSDELVSRELHTQSHPIGLMALVAGSFTVLYILQRFQYDFFSDITFLVVGLTLAGLALYYFFRSIHNHDRPLLELRSMRYPRYIVGVGIYSLCYLVLGANNYMLPVFMQRTLGFSWEIVGQFQTMGLLSALFAWVCMAWMIPKWPSAKKFFVIGFLALTMFGWHLMQLTVSANLWTDVLPALIGNGIFLMFVMATTAVETFRDVQHHDAVFSHAQQFKNMVAQFATALGISFSTIALQWRTSEHYGVLNAKFAAGDPIYLHHVQQIANSITSAVGAQAAQSISVATLAQELTQQSTLLACMDYFSVIAMVGIAGTVVMLMQRLMK
ncbi:Major Facilitator Superfamily protein [Collimonas sp. OK607]|uniref:MFS transporter n=1 Tax=Collimonas sp. OK607 TaxID=1798194 RepID=UPI0008F014F8|nr:MFS transporter [Collimonas sp. OK607]SFB20890.1 Major Facilitator Superfamily protein [Collimonas sp. OK607]